HAHDSICGCSIDKVHRDNEQRFQAVIDGASTYIENTLSQLCSRNPESFNNRLYVFSLIPGNKKVVNIERDIFIPASDDQGSLRLVCEGKKLPMDIISRKWDEGFYSTNERAPGWNEGVIYKVVFQLPFDGISLREIEIIPEKTNVLYGVMSCVDRTIENDFYRITAEPNGSLTIVDRKSGIIREDMHIISSFSDHGDSYNYSAPVDDFVARAVESGRLEKKSGSTFSELTVSYEIRSPYSKKESRIVSSPVTVRIRLYKNDTPIEFTTSIDNRNQDRVVRLNFPLGSSTDESFGDTAFDYVKRKGILGKPLHSAPGKEDSMGIYSSLSSIYAGGITVSHSGINEYGLSDWSESERALTCTLLRSTSHLSVRDPGSRGGGAGPVIETPEGQCPGRHSWKYWLSFGKAEDGPALAKKLRTSHAIVQGQFFNGEIPGLRLLSDVLTVTSLKKTEAGDWQMRLYNPSEKEQHFILECHCALQLVELDLKGHEIGLFDRLSVNPKEILTLRIQHT
ncbi:MAG: hypothetical protein JXR86_19755, partial [Spirochaetales bacterium]|nr:hypothetical protein [Spirochaetales bacterium]